jgi:hypothetical protein
MYAAVSLRGGGWLDPELTLGAFQGARLVEGLHSLRFGHRTTEGAASPIARWLRPSGRATIVLQEHPE